MTFKTMSDSRHSRIPATLQAIFLASNRGQDVNNAPPERAAFKTYFRNWFFQKRSGGQNSTTGSTNVGMVANVAGNQRNVSKASSVVKPLPSEKLIISTVVGSNSCSQQMSTLSSGVTNRPQPTLSPQGYFDAVIRSRGYSVRRYSTLESGYYNKPTPLQMASYGNRVIELVRTSNGPDLETIMSVGLSPNPCNQFGESVLHLVCRLGDHNLLEIMLNNGTSVQVADDYGRTPLHDACWSPNPSIDVFRLLVQRDRRLLYMQDKRGCLPLTYVRTEHWIEWKELLANMLEDFWPARSLSSDEKDEGIPPLVLAWPNSCPLPDPPQALTVELAEMVASGRLEPHEAKLIRSKQPTLDEDSNTTDTPSDEFEEDFYDEADPGSDFDSGDDESDFGSDDDSDEYESLIDEQEMADILFLNASLRKNSQAAIQI